MTSPFHARESAGKLQLVFGSHLVLLCRERERESESTRENVTLTLLAEISGTLSCLPTATVTISAAHGHRLIVDLNLELDQMTLGARITN